MKEKRLKKMKTTVSRIDKDKSFYEVFFNILHFTILKGCLKQCGVGGVKFYIQIKQIEFSNYETHMKASKSKNVLELLFGY